MRFKLRLQKLFILILLASSIIPQGLKFSNVLLAQVRKLPIIMDKALNESQEMKIAANILDTHFYDKLNEIKNSGDYNNTSIPLKTYSDNFFQIDNSDSNVTSNQVNRNYTRTISTVSISGYIRDGNSNGIDGVTVTFSNSGGTTTTNSSGYYSQNVSYGYSGTATPSLSGWTFSPVNILYTNVAISQTNQNHSALPLASITISEPSYYGTVWTVGGEAPISWSSVGIDGNINIKLSTDGGNTFPIPLATNIPNIGSYTGIVPNYPSTSSKIKVESVSDNTVNDISANFVIQQQNSSNFWMPRSSPYNQYIQAIAIDNSTGDIFAAIEDGVYKSTDDGVSWQAESLGTSDAVLCLYISPLSGNIFAGTQGSGIYLSTDKGKTWLLRTSGDLALAYSIVGNASGDTLFAASITNGVYRSGDNGITWNSVNYGLTTNGINILGISKSGEIFAASEYGIFRSEDNANSWVQVYSSSLNWPTSFAFASSTIYFTDVGNVYRSTDEGNNWTIVDSTLSSLIGNIVLAANTKDYIYAGTNIGAFISKDNGNNWVSENSGLWTYSPDWVQNNTGRADTVITSLAMDGLGYLYAGTNFGSLYRSADKTTPIESRINTIPVKYSLSQNYPNPFNPTTTINYSVPRASLVTIKIYDILGREIASLVNEEKVAGNYSVQFNSRNLASGVYFYRMQAGNPSTGSGQSFVQTKKLILMK